MPIKNDCYHLGCPVWACPDWRGSVYAANARRDSWLRAYSETFNSVEGNSTFYGIPRPETFQRWANETADGFQFSLKFPREITHDRQLVNARVPTEQFLEGLQVLQQAKRLGSTFLQLSPHFGPQQFGALKKYLLGLPREFRYAVEVRHPGYFLSGPESQLDNLLTELSIDRVIFDSRPLYSKPPEDEYEVQSQKRKPKVPIRTQLTGPRPVVRLVGRNDLATVAPWIEEWVEQTAQWIEAGISPYIFTHTPNDRWAPEMARMFNDSLAKRLAQVSPGVFNHYREQQKNLFD